MREWLWSTIIVLAFLVLYWRRIYNDHIVVGGHFMESDDWLGQIPYKMRTPLQLPTNDVLPKNIFFRLALLWAIWWRCTKKRPFIVMSDHNMGVMLPKVCNTISAITGEGVVARMCEDEQLPTISHDFFFVITFEKYGWMLSRKIRVLLFTKKQLDRLVSGKDQTKLTANTVYEKNRAQTISAIVTQYIKESSQTDVKHPLVHPVELSFRV